MADNSDIRIGTADRERALADLSDHFSAGRLSVAEFDERSAAIAAAATRRELATVFADLPNSPPPPAVKQPDEPAKIQGGVRDWRTVVVALTPIAAIVLMSTLHSWLWLLLIPAVSTLMYAGERTGRDRRRRRRRRDLEDHR
ncbi:MAG: DUF1707 domain-containing protein [Mycobacteriaceae bacterium]|nr:DUF1707 domain-containing protein [Mycobacteriaceae bacterium]